MADRVAVLRRVIDGRRALCSDGVTHDELCALLPHYAAGLLDEDASCALRMHLADGCVACLDELFPRPVGLPRALRQEAPSTALQEETPSPTVPRQERPFPAPPQPPGPSHRALPVTTVSPTLTPVTP